MRELKYRVRGQPKTIHVVENHNDLHAFVAWVRQHNILAFDTETTGLGIYLPGFRVRMAQFGTDREAYVIPVDLGEAFAWHVKCALEYIPSLLMHNASFDIQAVAKFLGVDLKALFKKTIDTGILSRLWDSRGKKDGGPGHSMEDLIGALIDKVAAEEVKASIGRMAREEGISKEEFFRRVPFDHDGYNLYAGMDTIFTFMLYLALKPLVPPSAAKLIPYEHDIARVCAEIERNGFLVDVDYTKALAERLHHEETWYQILIEEFTDDDEFSTNSTDEVARFLLDYGWNEFEFTPSGRLKVDDALLNRAAARGIEFAEWVRQVKKAKKWRKTWPESFLAGMDENNYAHASINPLAALTGRMSISGIPAQTLPSKDALIRNCFIADPGHVIASVDYKAQELRVTAALSEDPTMLRAFRDGLDLHQITADGAGVDRKIGKMTNFLTTYGGGPNALASQAHIDPDLAKEVIKSFFRQYPGVKEFSVKTFKEAMRDGYITTIFGRRIYTGNAPRKGMNYKIQSASRDITCSALLRLDKAGYTPYVKLPIHDEVLFSFPEEHAEYGAREAGRIMLHRLKGLDIPTDPEVGGRAWGSLYEAA